MHLEKLEARGGRGFCSACLFLGLHPSITDSSCLLIIPNLTKTVCHWELRYTFLCSVGCARCALFFLNIILLLFIDALMHVYMIVNVHSALMLKPVGHTAVELFP